jgi:Flp pilus assembly protein TadB
MGSFAVLAVNSILLLAVTVLLAYLVAANVNFKNALYRGIGKLNNKYNERRLKREIIKYNRILMVKMSLVEKIELFLIDKSNIRHYLPFMNFYLLVSLCLLIFIATFGPVYKILLFFPSTVVICSLFSLVPLLVLDLMGRYNSEKIRRKLAEFISVLNRWCSVKEDIFYAFERSVESNIGMPLKIFVRDMVIQVDRGIEPLEALDILQMKVNNAQFNDFIVNIKQNIKHRGDIRKLLTNLERQFYKIEEEYNRRKISTYKDRMVLYFVMFIVLFIGYYFIKFNPKVEEFYLRTLWGKGLLTFFSVLYACGFYLSFKISKFNY